MPLFHYAAMPPFTRDADARDDDIYAALLRLMPIIAAGAELMLPLLDAAAILLYAICHAAVDAAFHIDE